MTRQELERAVTAAKQKSLKNRCSKLPSPLNVTQIQASKAIGLSVTSLSLRYWNEPALLCHLQAICAEFEAVTMEMLLPELRWHD